ncbi:hypothetical protein PYW08_012145 [Mythimna loreyi]|uniref:Uncharacterized protein n=1 Tax=Mythimna loreyi TaxID=667449 RepID=A0ACC2Q176_9NEOP|nr:hypothetical protein PYW08_012145 [Mythimna loreyi]
MRERAKKKAAKPKDKKEKHVYVCPHCHKQFDNSSNWSSHVKLHSTEEPYHCELCDYKCKVKKYLSRHVKKAHTKPTGHQCPVCGKCFHFDCGLRNHMRVHTREKPYKCEYCDKAFSSSYTLSGHKMIHTGEKPFQCQYCDYACRDSSTIKRHMERHMGITKNYTCSICKKDFKKKQTLQIHVDEVHFELDTRKYSCEQCDKVFKTKATLTFHVSTVHKKTNREKCEICGRVVTKNNMLAHMRRHVDVKPYKCSYKPCGKRFGDKGDLKRHLNIHFPDSQHRCPVCHRRFSRRFRLAKHMRNGCRRAQCNDCGQLFSTKFFLAQHIKNAHGPYPKLREYLCDICEMVTYNRRCIIQHLKYGHGTVNDTKCQICKKDYFKCEILKEHYLSHHNLKYTLLDQKKDDIVIIKEEPVVVEEETGDPVEVEEERGDPPEFMYEVEIHKQEIINDPPSEPLLKPISPEHFTIDADTITYSKKVLSEDISHCLIERENTTDVFDDFFIGHVLQKNAAVDTPKQIVDEKKKECVEKRLEELLTKVRIQNQWAVLEKLRKQYNRRIKMATCGGDKKEQKQNIRYFKNPKGNTANKSSNDTHIDDKNESANDTTADELANDTTANEAHIDDNNSTKDLDRTTNDSDINKQNNDSENPKNNDENEEISQNSTNGEANNEMTTDKVIDEETTKESDDDDVVDDEKDPDYRDDDFGSNSDDETNPNGKLTFHTHQCYICFKLFKTKTDLKLHCRNHFDLCNEKMLKKCPFCGYVTNKTITRHIKLVHNLSYDIRKNGRIKEKETPSGSKYVFQIDKDCDLDIIPSISNLNKIASMKIDERKRQSNNLFLGTTKLVKKGGDWIVQKQKVDLNTEYLLPEFSKEEYLSLKCIGNNYLERIRNLSILAKKKGLKILYPCEGCDKICLTMSALKLHSRKHEANPKQFKPKVWKNKIVNGFNGRYSQVNKVTNKKKKKYSNNNQNNTSSVTDKTSNKKTRRLERVGKKEDPTPKPIPNRLADPNPVKNNHKCDRELIEFYHKNIKGGDIEFWQFLKIFNKMSREKINDFQDLEGRYDFGMHNIKNNDTTENTAEVTDDNNTLVPEKTSKTKSKKCTVEGIKKKSRKIKKIIEKKKAFTRAIMISKKEHLRRIELRNQMRERLKMAKT